MSWSDSGAPAGQEIFSLARPAGSENYAYPAACPYLVFHTDEPVVVPLTATPQQYVVRDWKGVIVATGIPSTPSLNLGIMPPGSYRVYFNNPSSSGNAWYGGRGSMNISVWRRKSGMSNRPAVERTSGDYAFNQEVVGALNTFMMRFTIFNAEAPNTGQIPNLSSGIVDYNLYSQYYLSYPDTARPTKQAVFHFSNGTRGAGAADGVSQVISQFGTDDIWYECRNEPDNDTNASVFVTELQAFHAMVKAANPNAKVLGPNQVSLNGSSLNWTREFFEMGGGDYIDGFSFHAYNVSEGELERGRKNADALIDLLTEFGQQNKPRFMTEWGMFASAYGSFQPLRLLRKMMFEVVFWEQYGVPKEHYSYFYNKSHGFWDYPSFYATDHCGLLSPATAARVFSEEIFGKAYVSRLDFGDEDNDFLGSFYQAPGNGVGVVVVVSAGRFGDPMTFEVTGAGTVKVIDTMGVEATHTVTNGILTVPIPGTPIYIQLPTGATCVPCPRKLGRNLTHDGAWARTVSSTGLPGAYFLSRGEFSDGYPYHGDTPLPVTLTQTLGQLTTFDTVVIRGTLPWQNRSGILGATVEVYEGGSWVQAGTIENTYTWFARRSSFRDTNCWSETYYDERSTWMIEIGRQVRTDRVRLIVTQATNGGEVVEVDTSIDGQGWGGECVSLQAIEIYNAHHARRKQYVINQ